MVKSDAKKFQNNFFLVKHGRNVNFEETDTEPSTGNNDRF